MDYPTSFGQFQSWFRADEDCRDYLAWLRWPQGYRCPSCCAIRDVWELSDGRIMCVGCGRRSSVTAGTIFHRTRTPLTVWFAVAWLFATNPSGVSALAVQRSLEIGSYQTAWSLLHRLRSVAVRPGRDRLAGEVEVDETYVGGVAKDGTMGRGSSDKALVAIAVEADAIGGHIGRCRLATLNDASQASLGTFLRDYVERGTVVRTDGWKGYGHVARLGYVHQPHSQRSARSEGRKDAHALLPAAHRVASLLKRWLLGTHQGSVSHEHLQAYLHEFAFRFNRRRASHRGLLFYRLLEHAVRHEPLPHRDLIATPRPKSTMPTPTNARGRPPSLERPAAHRPWRQRAQTRSA